MRHLFPILAFCALLAGCGVQPRVEIRRVNIAIPVACQEDMPTRPVMPTEQLAPGVLIDVAARAAYAEIERREGYEGELRAALENCRKPIDPSRVAN